MSTTTKVLTIESTSRLHNSVNGNPSYLVFFTDGSRARTSSDISFAYEINNPEYRDVPLEVTFTKAGRIVNATPVKGN